MRVQHYLIYRSYSDFINPFLFQDPIQDDTLPLVFTSITGDITLYY